MKRTGGKGIVVWFSDHVDFDLLVNVVNNGRVSGERGGLQTGRGQESDEAKHKESACSNSGNLFHFEYPPF